MGEISYDWESACSDKLPLLRDSYNEAYREV